MTRLLLIRHGQAQFGTADYDRLSLLGERQARLIGRHLARIDAIPHTLLSGRMQRQAHTAQLAAAHWQAPPELTYAAAFDEYDAEALFRAYLARVLDENTQIAARRDEIFADARLFQKVFEQITRHWLAASPPDDPGCEPWTDFTARVGAALSGLRRDHGRDSTIGVFTSGGPIAVAVATAVDASAAKTIEINWSICNAAITQLRATRDGWRLSCFNDTSALEAAADPALITYR